MFKESQQNGFVFDADEVPLPAVQPKRSPGKRVNWNDGERGCDSCPLSETWDNIQSPQMRLYGEADADILVLGEAPGEDEDREGRPFVGAAGRLLDRVMSHRHRDRLAMTNAVRCHPAHNRTPNGREVHCCSTHLENDIAAGKYKAILGLGNVPLSRFIDGDATITHVHGLKFPVQIAGKVLWYYPTLHPAFVLRMGGDRPDQSPMLPILQNDLKRFFERVDKWKKPVIEPVTTGNVICAYTEDEARGWCAKLRLDGQPIGFDLETNGLRPNVTGAKILTAAVSNGERTVAWPVHHPQMSNDWGLPLLLEMTQGLRWIAHNAAFELAWLYEHARISGTAWEPTAGFDDSMIAARLFQRRETCLNLGILTRLYTGVNIKKLSANINPEKMIETPLEDILPYNGLDAWGSWRIHKLLFPYVNEETYDSIRATVASVTQMQLLGLDIDQNIVKELHEDWTGRAEAAVTHAKTVYEVKQYERVRQKEFNIGSNDHVAEALMEFGGVTLTATAGSKEGAKQRYTVDDAVLSKLASPLAADVTEYRHAKKMVSTYIEPLALADMRFVDHRIHPVYSTMLTKTLRLSCEDPNAQNFPKRKDRELRRPIVPPPGCVWASADYGQLEARVYGMASRDRALCDSLIAEEDIHTYWLDIILQEYPPYMDRLATKVTPNDTVAQIRKGGRDIIKSDFVFASFFGTTAKNVAERTSIPLEIATEVLGRFWRRYARAYDWLKAQRKEYTNSGSTKNLCGVERYGYMPGNEMINTPIQSTAARLVLEAQNEMHQWSKRISDPHLMPRINIHDDLTFALPDDEELLPVYMEQISTVLLKLRFDWQIVPLKVEWKTGRNWAELKNACEFTGDYRR